MKSTPSTGGRVVTVHVIRAFVSDAGGGNPAGVVLDADSLSKQQRQQIAAQLKLSEIAFVSKSSSGTCRVEFFTPTKQIELCGHATIGTFVFLAEKGLIRGEQHLMETIRGPIHVSTIGGSAYMEQAAPVSTELDEAELDVVLGSLRIPRTVLHPKFRPTIVSTGSPFLIFGVKDAASLLKITPDFKEVAEISAHYDLIGYYLFTEEVRAPGHHACTRMFAPHYGIKEESATGMAAGPLGCVLVEKLGISGSALTIEQGYLMKPPSPSHILVALDIEGGSVRSLRVGGAALKEREETVTL